MVIDEGRCLYYGPTDDAKAYFEALGFHCPPRWTTAEFLTSVVDPHVHEVRPGWEDRIPRTAEEFQQTYKNSEVYQRNLADIQDLESLIDEQGRRREAAQTKATKRKNYTIPFHQQVLACTRRQFLVLLGDRISLFGKWGGIVFQAVIVGSLFFNMPQTAVGLFPRGGKKFFSR